MTALVNEERRREGLPDLAVHAEIGAIAWDHSERMAADGRIWHNDAYFSAENRGRLGAKALGENVALNGSAEDAHARLMASPAHRSNILDARFTHLGLAAVRDADGVLYITQDFAQISSPEAAAAPAPASVAAPVEPPSQAVVPPEVPAPNPPLPDAPRVVLSATDASQPTPVALTPTPPRQIHSSAPTDPTTEQNAGVVAGAVMALAAVGLCDRAGRRVTPNLFRTLSR